jgi:hypothetical protein
MPIYSLPDDLLPSSRVGASPSVLIKFHDHRSQLLTRLRAADHLERKAARYWELFYQRNRERFFADRHYLHKEFPELADATRPLTLLEARQPLGRC